MRILADENVPAAVVTALQERGDDIVWIRTVAPGIDDQEVFRRARDERRVILTFDKEFGELAFMPDSLRQAASSCFASPLFPRRQWPQLPLRRWGVAQIGQDSLLLSRRIEFV